MKPSKCALLLLLLASSALLAPPQTEPTTLTGLCRGNFASIPFPKRHSKVLSLAMRRGHPLSVNGYPQAHHLDQFLKELGEPSKIQANSVDGIPATFAAPDTPQNLGKGNRGIYYFSRGDEPRVLKILRLPAPTLQELNEWGTSISQIDQQKIPNSGKAAVVRHQLLNYGRVLQGALLGEECGGPKVRRFGILTSEAGQSHFYIEMERLFPETEPQSLKAMLRTDASSQKAWQRMNSVRSDGKTAMDSMARLYLHALRKGINPDDTDFMVDRDGRVRWVDCELWKKLEPVAEQKESATTFVNFINLLSRRPNQPQIFFEHFLRHLKKSDLTPNERRSLLTQLLGSRFRGVPGYEDCCRTLHLLIDENDKSNPADLAYSMMEHLPTSTRP